MNRKPYKPGDDKDRAALEYIQRTPPRFIDRYDLRRLRRMASSGLVQIVGGLMDQFELTPTGVERLADETMPVMRPHADPFAPWLAWINLTGWHGATRQAAMVIGETPKRYRVVAESGSALRLAGRGRRISGDQAALVPKHAVSRRCPLCSGKGTCIEVDAIGPGSERVNPRPSTCMVCDGTGVPIP